MTNPDFFSVLQGTIVELPLSRIRCVEEMKADFEQRPRNANNIKIRDEDGAVLTRKETTESAKRFLFVILIL